MGDYNETQIVQQLQEIILQVMPKAKLINKYGGIIVERIAGQADTQCCGYFAYSEHISLEFTQGSKLADPRGVLEGIGKLRRHIKLYSVENLEAMQCENFLKQVPNL